MPRSHRFPTRAQAAPLLPIACAVALACAVPGRRAEAAPCPQVATTVTCNVGDTPDPGYYAPSVDELVLLGGAPGNPLNIGQLELSNTDITLDPLTLTFTATGSVIASVSNQITGSTVQVYNYYGSNDVSIGQGTAIYAFDTKQGFYNFGRTSTASLTTTSYGGSIEVLNTSLLIPYTFGLFTEGQVNVSAESILTSTGVVTVVGGDSYGVAAFSFGPIGGDSHAASAGEIQVAGNVFGQGRAALYAYSQVGGATADAGGILQLDNRSYTGVAADAFAVWARSDENANAATVNVTGSISTWGERTGGVTAQHNGAGDAIVTATSTSSITTNGNDADGVLARADLGGDVSVQTAAVSTAGTSSQGVSATSTQGAVAINSSAGTISTLGADSNGVLVNAATTATITTGNISTAGANAYGVRLQSGGATTVNGTGGTIATTGDNAVGMGLTLGGSAAHTLTMGAITTTGLEADALVVSSPLANVQVNLGGAITTTGVSASAVTVKAQPVAGASGALATTVGAAVAARGEWGAGVTALSSANRVDLNVLAGGSLLGGWEPTLASTSTHTGFASAGAILGSDATHGAFVDNAGSIGALSDRALQLTQTGALQLVNRGTLAGYLTLGAGDDLITNGSGASWNLRHFADTTGDGVRDTKRVARVEFGAGADALMNESGAFLRLASIPGAPAADPAFQYTPNDVNPGFYTIAGPGVKQAQLLGLERFENRGAIVLSDQDAGGAAPVAGDILMITSGTVSVTGVRTPGATPGVFVSDGGLLYLDTVLDDGGANSRTDMLVVDSTRVGNGGFTRVVIRNAGGLGAETVGPGIKLVDVLGGPAASAGGAFGLAAPVFGGMYRYYLYRSAPSLDDGDWYLRTQLPTTPPPNPPGDPGDPGPRPPLGPAPTTFREEAPLLAALPGFLRQLDTVALASHQRRVGDESGENFGTQKRRGRSWLRVMSEDVDSQQQGLVAPSTTGRISGVQFGVELLDGGLIPSRLPSLGVYAGRVQGDGLVNGFADGITNLRVGSVDATNTFAGLYGSHRKESGFYLDFIIQRSWYDGTVQPASGAAIDLAGTGLSTSLEMGRGFNLTSHVQLEPQLQVIAQTQKFDNVAIPNATVAQQPGVAVNARAGLRLKGRFPAGAGSFQPYVRANVWKGLNVDDSLRFTNPGSAAGELETRLDATVGEFGLGFGWAINRWMMVYAEGNRLFEIDADDEERRARGNASLGLRVSW